MGRAGGSGGADLVDVALGEKGCLEACRSALDAGARVVAVAPAAREFAGFRELLRSGSGRLRLAHPVRFDPKYAIAANETKDGRLGNVITVRVIRSGSADRHIGVEELNTLDALLYLGGPVTRIFGRRQRLRGTDVDSSLSVLRFENRAIGYGEACTAYDPPYFYEVIEVVAQGGMVEYDSFSRFNRLFINKKLIPKDSYHVPPYQAMASDYLAHFRGEDESAVSDSDSLALLDLAGALHESAESPKAVKL